MNPSEYEKILNEAFGKPEKRNLLKSLKKHKKLALCIAVAFVLIGVVLAVYLLREPDLYVHKEVPKPVWLQIEHRRDNGFLGRDVNGKLWWVNCDLSRTDKNISRCWISVKEEVSGASPIIEPQVDYAVVADNFWYELNDERMYVGYGWDICEFDIDRDGVVEQCVLGGSVTSGIASYELSVWNGDVCEKRIFFSTDHYIALAFYTEAEELKVACIERSKEGGYLEHELRIAFADGNYTLLNDAEPVDILPEPTKFDPEKIA